MTSDGLVWAGGDFITEDPNPRLRLAAFDASTGAIASFHRDPMNTGVSALAASGPMVYVGGQFTTIGGQPRNNVAAVQNVPGEDGTVCHSMSPPTVRYARSPWSATRCTSGVSSRT